MKYQPMLCQLGTKDFLKKKEYFFEVKLDGVRVLLYRNGKNELINKNGIRKTEQFAEIAGIEGKFLPKNCVLDGEVVVYRKGVPDFQALMKRDHANELMNDVRREELPATYVVFDILELNKKSLVHLPLSERKKILAEQVKEKEGVLEISFATENGPALWKEIEKRKLEGVIAKKKGSMYLPGERSWDWVKIKNLNTVDAIIVGYTSYKRGVSSLAMALYKKGKLTFTGKVGTGYTEDILEMLQEKLEKIQVDKAPVVNPPPEDLQWVKPMLVAEIAFLKVTDDNQLRAPVFKGLRDDKTVEECTWEDQIKN